jgi:hypothetical protein
MSEAVARGLIKVDFQGTGYVNVVNMRLTSSTDKPYVCVLPVGTILTPREERFQRMVVTLPVEYHLELIRSGATTTVKVNVLSLDMGRDSASTVNMLDLAAESATGDLKTLVSYPLLLRNDIAICQYAVMTIKENPNSLQGYWPLVGSYPTAEHIKKIRVLFKEAGISEDKYQIFKIILGSEK